MRRAHGQSIPVKRLDDFRSQDSLELFRIRVFVSNVAEHIPAPSRYFQFFTFHRNISFNLFRRSFTKSISRSEVLMHASRPSGAPREAGQKKRTIVTEGIEIQQTLGTRSEESAPTSAASAALEDRVRDRAQRKSTCRLTSRHVPYLEWPLARQESCIT
jgi:hypothetical protein